ACPTSVSLPSICTVSPRAIRRTTSASRIGRRCWWRRPKKGTASSQLSRVTVLVVCGLSAIGFQLHHRVRRRRGDKRLTCHPASRAACGSGLPPEPAISHRGGEHDGV